MNRVKRIIRALLSLLLILGLVTGVYTLWQVKRGKPVEYITAPVSHGDIVQSVSASGTLKPSSLVTVGTQVTGPVKKIYVDYNDKVKKDQLLAEIDPTLLQAQIDQTQAQLFNAKSSLELAELNASRLKQLLTKGYVSRSEWERADQDAKTARTNYKVSKAQVDRDLQNLQYAQIRSPVDGVVISRDINEGQTVQASFQAPELFKIAEDLTHMKIEINLSEADIGRVAIGQRVLFNVDAHPDKSFEGMLRQIRLNSNSQQGVVTYTALVDVSNPDQLLLPGMTAYAKVITVEQKNALRVPNAALRYHPLTLATPPPTEGPGVYILSNEKPVRITVGTGLADDNFTQISSGNLNETSLVIIQEVVPESDEHE